MRDEEIRQLLHASEADVEWSRLDTKRAITQVQSKRLALRRRRRVAAAVVPLLLLAGAWFALRPAANAPLPIADRATTPADADIDQRLREIQANLSALQVALVELELEQLAQQPSDVMTESRRRAHEELNIVAAQLLHRADRLLRDQRPATEVAAVYHDIVQLFPDTYAADEARARLEQTVREGGI